MKKTGYSQLIEKIKPKNLPDKFKDAYEEWNLDGNIVSHEERDSLIERYDLTEAQRSKLHGYLKDIENSEELSEYVTFLVYSQCDGPRYVYWIDTDTDFNSASDAFGETGGALNLFVCLSCMGQARKDLIKRSVPKEYYENIPHRMFAGQMRKFKESGDLSVHDMPCALNFYSLSIYLFDRFLFVPCKFGELYSFYRNSDNRVMGFPHAGQNVDEFGQLIPEDGDGSYDLEEIRYDGHYYGCFAEKRKTAFTTEFREDDEMIAGYEISPCGYIRNKTVAIHKEGWKKILDTDDWMIGFHIPEGPGYTPERVRTSMKLAWDFFTKYYPEIPFKGFWSSSWLYDARLSLCMDREANITHVRRQFFNYSGGWNGESTYVELYGDSKLLLDEAPMKTSLQRNVADYLRRGGRFCDTGMVYFPEELSKDYNFPIYITDEDTREEKKVLQEIMGKVKNGEKGI